METLSSTEERRLLAGVKQAVDLVDLKRLSPDEALTKVAREQNWSRGNVRAAVSAFNNGRQVAQWRSNEDMLDKLAEFPLADYNQVHDAIWGQAAAEKVAADRQGIDPAYSLPPTFVRDPYRDMLRSRPMEKVAGVATASEPAVSADPFHGARQAWEAQQREKRSYESARSNYAQAHDWLRVKLGLLENYFKKSACVRMQFPQVDSSVQMYYGEAGKQLMDVLAASFPREKRGDDSHLRLEKPLDLQAAPFNLVEDAIVAARHIYHRKQALDAAGERLEKTAEALRPFVETPSLPSNKGTLSVSLLDKAAGLLGDSTKEMLDSALGGQANRKVQDLSLELEDPDHENELRKIRSQSVLSQLMTDPENPISGHEPDEVLDAYNQIAGMAPRAAEKPLALQTLLAKKLSGHMEPFEIKDVNDIEKGLRTTHGSALSVGLLNTPAFNPQEQN